MAKRKPTKPCERCDEVAISGQRYCKQCRKAVLAEMKEAGHLETGGYGRRGQARTPEMKEVVQETKSGTWQR